MKPATRPALTTALALAAALLLAPHNICLSQAKGALAQADALNEKSVELFLAGRYTEAADAARRALAIRERVRGATHADVAESLNNLSIIYIKIGRYDAAEPLLVRALRIRLRVFGDRHPSYAQTLNGLGGLYTTTGRYPDAEKLYVQALGIREKALGAEHPDVANSLNNLAALYDSSGRHHEAESLYLRALSIREKKLGAEHPDYANTLHNLARLYKATGRYDRAEWLYSEATEIRKKTLGTEHPDYAVSLNNLAALYLSTGRAAEAERLYAGASEVFKKAFGENHPVYAISLNNLAMAYETAGSFEKAVPLYRQAMRVYEATFGKEHPDYADTVNNLAGAYRITGDYKAAEPLYLEALSIRKRVLGEGHPSYAISLDGIAALYEAAGRSNEALTHISQALSVEQDQLARVLGVSSESAMRDYLNSLGGPFDRLISIAYGRLKTDAAPAAAAEALNWTLARKAVIMDTLIKFRGAQALAEGDPALAQRLGRLRYLRQRASSLPLQSAGTGGAADREDEAAALREEADRLEAGLNRALSARTSLGGAQRVDWETLRRRLRADEVLVDFVRAHIYDFKAKGAGTRWQPERYFAFVLGADFAAPRMIDLGAAAEIDHAVAELRARVNAFKEDWKAGKLSGDDPLKSEAAEEASYRAAAAKLHRLVFTPLRLKPDGRLRLFIAPDSQLNLVPFEGLVDEDGRYNVEHYRFAYLSSGRDLLRARAGEGLGVVIFADPDFDMGQERRAVKIRELLSGPHARRDPRTPPAQVADGPARTVSNNVAPPQSVRDESRKARGGRWDRLAESAGEAEDIRGELADAAYSAGGKINTFVRDDALEDVFKTIRSPRLLHVSTHGFFPEQEEGAPFKGRPDVLSGSVAVVGQELLREWDNPLLSSGLVLNGANMIEERAGGRALAVDDGWLTAEEISLMDLRGTELVVLSACGTGLGEVSAGEGVYGLRRAFQHAGARAVLLTLFEVPSAESVRLTGKFYAGLKAGRGKGDALREAQLGIISERRAREQAAHPFFWAGFILSGDPW